MPGFEATQGTQFGTVIEEATAIIRYSQMHADQPAVMQKEPGSGLAMQAMLQASHTSPDVLSQQGVAGQSMVHQSHTEASADARGTREAASAPLKLPAVASQSGAAVSSPQAAAAQSDAAVLPPRVIPPQTETVMSASAALVILPQAEPSLHVSVAYQAEATAPHKQALPASAQHSSLPVKAAAAKHVASREEQSGAEAVASAAAATQGLDDKVGEVLATEVQMPHPPPLDLPLSPQLGVALGDAADCASGGGAERGGLHRIEQGNYLPSKAGHAVAYTCNVKGTAAAMSQPASAPVGMPVPEIMHPGSPTQNLHLHLTCLDSQAAEQQAIPVAGLQSQQLQLTDHPLSPAAQQAQQALGQDEDEPCEAFGESPAKLSLYLDTQLPDQAALEDRAAAADGVLETTPQPAARRGWWGQPWSVAPGAEEAASLPAGLAQHQPTLLLLSQHFHMSFEHSPEMCITTSAALLHKSCIMFHTNLMYCMIYHTDSSLHSMPLVAHRHNLILLKQHPPVFAYCLCSSIHQSTCK